MKRSILLTLLLFWSCTNLPAQILWKQKRCVDHHHLATPAFENWLQSKESIGIKNTDEVYRIPIVVHILHLGEAIGEGTNLSEAQIISQIAVINHDFRRKAGTRGYNEHPDGGDARIEFVLAQRDPDGTPTNGLSLIHI